MHDNDEEVTVKESLLELLFNALSDPEPTVRSSALRLLVRLPLPDKAWFRLARWVVDELSFYLLSGEAAKAQIPFDELLDTAIRIPVSSVRIPLYEFVEHGGDEGIRHKVLWKLAQAIDYSVAESFLWSMLEGENEYDREEAAFWLAHYNLQHKSDDLVSLAGTHPDAIVRFWLSIAALRLENYQPIIALINDYLESKLELSLLWGNPFNLASKVSECVYPANDLLNFLIYLQSVGEKPAPEFVQGFENINELLNSKRERLEDFIPFIGALIDELNWRLSSTEHKVDQPPQPSTAWEGSMDELVDKLMQGGEVEDRILAGLSAGQKTMLISAWFAAIEKSTATNEQPGPFSLTFGNEIIVLPGWFWVDFEPDLTQLFDIYLQLGAERSEMGEQIAWVISRAGINRLLEEYLPLLPMLETQDEAALLTLLEKAVVLSKQEFGPVYGAGPSTAVIEPPFRHFIDEMAAAIGPREAGLTLGEEEEVARYVQGEVYDNSDKAAPQKLEKAFLTGKEHLLKVWIGELQEGAIAAPQPIDLGLLPDMDSWELQVYFWEPNHAPEVQIGSLTVYQDQLPDLPVSTCEFTFTPHPDVADFKGRLAVVYEKNVLQMLFLEGKVLAEAASASESDKIRFEWAEVKGLRRPDQLQEFDMAFYNEADTTQGAGLMFFGGQAGLKHISGLDDGIQAMITALREAGAPGAASLKAREMDLVILANQGSMLYSAILEQIGTDNQALLQLREAQRLQLVSAVRDVFPLEMVYVYPPPNPDAVLCPNAQQAIEAGICFTCEGLSEEEAAKVVCPLGFLGMRCTIERHAIQPLQKTDVLLEDSDFLVRVGFSVGGKTINPLKSSLCATSANVTKGSRQKLTESLQALFPNSFDFAENWTEWKTKIKDDAPSTLVLVPHTLKDRSIPTLEIGSSKLWKTGINESVVRASKDARPLVLLIGCETAVPDTPYQGFAAAFSQAGAAITVMTLSPIHESHAVPITEILVNQFHQSALMQQTFSEALLQARRSAMGAGYAEVLTLVADGDADWILVEEG